MIKMKSTLKVKILLDPVPGWGHDPEDHVKFIQNYLDSTLPHYKPEVELVRVDEVEG